MQRTLAIVEREMRRFRRSPTLIVVSMIFPLVQLVILGYAFGGNVKHLKLGVVASDHGVPAVHLREMGNAVSSGARTFDPVDYSDQGQALADLRDGKLNGVLAIPPDFSRRVLAKDAPRVALIEDNTDTFVSATMAGVVGGLVSASNSPAVSASRVERVGVAMSVRSVHANEDTSADGTKSGLPNRFSSRRRRVRLRPAASSPPRLRLRRRSRGARRIRGPACGR